MKLDAKLREGDSGTMWREYLGFMDLSVDGYMDIQNRLMLEQLKGWCASGLGKQILGGAAAPETVEEFRRVVPLTTYEDYAETLLQKRDDLPRGAGIPKEQIGINTQFHALVDHRAEIGKLHAARCRCHLKGDRPGDVEADEFALHHGCRHCSQC